MPARSWSILAGILAAAAAFFAMQYAAGTRDQCWTAAVAMLCAFWWVLEALPLAATSLVPLVMFPLTGVLTERQAANSYGDPIVLLFMGGFMISKAAEHWGAHRRIAQGMIATIGGTSGRRLVLAMMLATALISMWISNTAVTLMMLPVAMALVERDTSGRLAVPLLLGVAYSASIGGIATPIGTAPNGVFLANYQHITGETIPFYQWMILGVPLSLVLLGAAWLLLTFRLGRIDEISTSTQEHWTTPQKRTVFIFGLACLAWITREIPCGGWSHWLAVPDHGASDMTVALAAALALFLTPSGDAERGDYLLDWPTAAKIPWGILILFGGGIAIANAFEESGLSARVGELVQGLNDWPLLAVIGVVCFSLTFFSEFTSNTATSNILMPILAAAAKANGMNPALLMIPATLANNLAFMMPVGTPPNAIVYSTGNVRIRDMVRAGFLLNIICATIVSLVCWQVLPLVFGHTK
jgi:solute carrier family 13 (sodium-dependent dicarboxylate transporter), member 2/3/5